MDRKSIIILVISFGLVLAWPKLINHFYPPPPKSTNLVEIATNGVAGTNQAILSTNASLSTPVPTKATGPEELISITNKTGVYTFTSHGGGLKEIEFAKYRSDVECGRTVQAERRSATLNKGGRAPVLALSGGEAFLGPEIYSLTRTESGVRAERTAENGLQIVKTFTLPESNYVLKASLRLENRSSKTVPVPQQEVMIGAATPMSAHDDGMEMGVFYFNGEDAEHVDGNLSSGFAGCGGSAKTEFTSPSDTGPVGWSAVHNRFFTIGVVPNPPAHHIISRRVELDHSKEFLAANAKARTNALQTALVFPATNLVAGSSSEKTFTIYAGPKEYNTLAQLGDQMKNKFDAIMNFGFFRLFAQGLLLSMNKLNAWGLSYGMAIVVITIIIKLVFWPLTNASTKSMKRMQLLQPQMKAIQEKYKDDPRKMNMKMMEFMKEHKVSPLGGCLPMLIQIPIFMGFYTMLRSAIELRGESFLWACDLSQADTIMFISGFPLNPMPLIWGVTMFVQAQMTPVSPGMDPTQQKIMKYMPLMILFFLYNMPAGLTLYWIVQNLLSILQMKLTKAVDVVPAPANSIVSGPKKKNK